MLAKRMARSRFSSSTFFYSQIQDKFDPVDWSQLAPSGGKLYAAEENGGCWDW